MPRLEVIETGDRFAEIENAWNALWLVRNASVFQSFEWIAGWYRRFGHEFQMRIGTAWDASGLVAVLPLAIYHSHGLRIIEWVAQNFSDYCDGFGDPSLFPALWTEVVDHKVDIVRLKNVSHNANTLGVFLANSGLVKQDDDVCLKIRSRWPDGESWFRNLNKKKRNNHSRGRRILDDMGPVTLTHYDTAPPDVIETLFTLKRQWMNAHKLSSAVTDADFGLLGELIAAMDIARRLHVVTLTCGDTLAAGSINIAEGKRLLAFLAGYDPKFERSSPGIMLMTEYTRWAFDHGFEEIDYLRGAEPYKFEFATDRTVLQSFTGALTLRGRAALTLYNAAREFRGTSSEPPKEIGGAYTTSAGTRRESTP